MEARHLLRSLLSAGRGARLESVRTLPGAGVHAEVSRIADRHRDTVLEFFNSLDTADRQYFVKAIAVWEDSVGGLGSVTLLHRLLPVLVDPYHEVFDWVLAHTRSYEYYSGGAKSFGELEAMRRIRTLRREESLLREKERAAEAQAKRTARATLNLYNAVRRGDAKAVAALLDQGADPKTTTPDGVTLHRYAISAGKTEIAALLKGEDDNER
jgi:hypothetical protein